MIETELKRIADALTIIAEHLSNPRMKAGPSLTPAGAQASAPVGKKIADDVVPAEALPSTGEQLRALGATIAEQMGQNPTTALKVGDFVTWVTKVLLPPYKVTRLAEVPADRVAEAAQQLYAYAKKEGLNG